MLEQLKIENFRCFKSFELEHLGRVNLLVGKNNSGKTSILEAVSLLCSEKSLNSLRAIIKNRGEYDFTSEGRVTPRRRIELFLCHLFNNHEIDYESGLKIYDDKDRDISISINKTIVKSNDISDETDFDRNYIIVESKCRNKYTEHRLTYDNTLVDDLRFSSRIDKKSSIVHFVTSSSLNTDSTIELFNQVVLTSEEDLLYQALRIVEPNIERIAPILLDRGYANIESKNGFVVKLIGNPQRIPIGSMGDGIWRILGLTLSLVSAKDGVLLVDEIDTGLHYTALEDMWRLIWETSKKLNVQVFATTHSSDCWKALEALASREDVGEEDISIQRIEKDAPRGVAYNKEEIATAVEREIEVR